MYVSVENDSGAYVTMFNAWKGYNIRLILTDKDELECQIIGAGGSELLVKMFIGDEDVPTGKERTIEFIKIDEVVIY